jgi:hypothetical protein
MIIFIYMLLLAEGKMDEACEPSRNKCSFGNWEALDRKSNFTYPFKGFNAGNPQ